MGWTLAISRNREALQAIVATLFTMLGLSGGMAPERISRSLHAAVLRLLRPAESATRRLIVIAARGLVVKGPPARPVPAGLVGKGSNRRVAFQLFDPRKRFVRHARKCSAGGEPHIRIFTADPRVAALWSPPPVAAVPAPGLDGSEVASRRLASRLSALQCALADLPRQAKRLARWRARRQARPGVKFTSPLRPGPPPGHRRTPLHEVDRVLAECHGLAFDALAPDTS
jgi:hypothetical protein